ncbi:helix-turn-helix domain-containing protein [Sediminibacillus massiliensis]|uniref:helix-turn-helix domain-containing protein n=1 Tax=Sediminibacillus massiliensis TaxID=1926277 RepID=UPI00098839F3|nr:helix-turn-helix transcriptional regulator [Sediminibacillus massiliensis]
MSPHGISKSVGERLRTIRKSNGLSQEKLAHLSNLHPTYIGQLERGEKNPTIDTIEKVSDALGITLGELFWFDGAVNKQQWNTILTFKYYLEQVDKDDYATILSVIRKLVEWKYNNNHYS